MAGISGEGLLAFLVPFFREGESSDLEGLSQVATGVLVTMVSAKLEDRGPHTPLQVSLWVGEDFLPDDVRLTSTDAWRVS